MAAFKKQQPCKPCINREKGKEYKEKYLMRLYKYLLVFGQSKSVKQMLSTCYITACVYAASSTLCKQTQRSGKERMNLLLCHLSLLQHLCKCGLHNGGGHILLMSQHLSELSECGESPGTLSRIGRLFAQHPSYASHHAQYSIDLNMFCNGKCLHFTDREAQR